VDLRQARLVRKEEIVPKRTCDCCGKEKDVEGGRTCEAGHFVCKACVWENAGFFGPGPRKHCPLDKKKLR